MLISYVVILLIALLLLIFGGGIIILFRASNRVWQLHPLASIIADKHQIQCTESQVKLDYEDECASGPIGPWVFAYILACTILVRSALDLSLLGNRLQS